MSAVYVWRYTLRSASSLNATSPRTEHEGALVRINEGFGCLHPWPSLGDDPLETQLRALVQEGNSTPLTRAALRCAARDGEARRKGVSLFNDPVPESHWLVLPGDEPESARASGFGLAKIKGAPDLEATRERVAEWVAEGFRIRLDFNETLPVGGFLSFWDALRSEDKAAIDVVEDPERWTEEGWEILRRNGVPIAVDRNPEKRWRRGDVFVKKPACFSDFPDREAKFFVTSYMDHALGQMFAASEAAGYSGSANLLCCGLLTHRCFEPDEFFERIRTGGARLQPVGGTGLGFDDLLEKLPWKRLN